MEPFPSFGMPQLDFDWHEAARETASVRVAPFDLQEVPF
jgi:hypothetical protein